VTEETTDGAVTGEVVDDSQAAPGESAGFSQGMRSIPDLAEDPAEAVPVLIEALDEARTAEAARVEDLQRTAAEFENYRKRATREQQETIERATQRLIEALLPVLDSFDGAFTHEAQSPGEESLLKGVTSTFHQLTEILEREGLRVIPSVGEPFDPAVHEAVTGGAGDDLVVSAEMRRGYMLKDRVIRPAMVAVSPSEDPGEEPEAQ